jgi:Fe-S oxidoreductase
MLPDSKTETQKYLFAPGCALMIYKPELARKIKTVLDTIFGNTEWLDTCCKKDPQADEKKVVINVCPGCDKRYGKDYWNITTISLWELLASSESFSFPDYKGGKMTIMDACPTRDNTRVQDSIRALLRKMNINITEPEKTRSHSICCGDSFYGEIPVLKVKEQMIKRTFAMPDDDVVVYCVSCIKSVYIGGKNPRYLPDLLFGETTLPKTYEPEAWHKELTEYIEAHS